ncbi:hypothetical protein bcgnr5389_08780 [Bacillus luti]
MWNVNVTEKIETRTYGKFYINYVECKGQQRHPFQLEDFCFIATMWNINQKNSIRVTSTAFILY